MTNVPLAGTDIDELRTSYQTSTWPQFVGLDLLALHVYTCTTIPTSVMVIAFDVAFAYACDIWKYAELPLTAMFDATETEPYISCPVPVPLAIGAAKLVALNVFEYELVPTCIMTKYPGGV
jgi:hypothetical protein